MKLHEPLNVWVNGERQEQYELHSEQRRFSQLDKVIISCDYRKFDISKALYEIDCEVINQNRLGDRWKVNEFVIRDMIIIPDQYCYFRCTWKDCYQMERSYISRPMLLSYNKGRNVWVVEARTARGWFY